jgi:hypothetical protein
MVGADHDDVRLELPHHATLVSLFLSKGAELESSGKTVDYPQFEVIFPTPVD